MPEQPKDLPEERKQNGSDQPSEAGTTRSYLTQIVVVLGVIAITVVVTLWLSRDSERPGVEILIPSPAPVTFQVSGAVVRPGVYSLDGEPRIDDAIDAAGGFTDDANIDLINRALRVGDGAKVVVPSLVTSDGTTRVDSSDADTSGSTTPSIDANSEDSEVASSGAIDLNTATKDQLITLPGVGEVRADSIIEWRANNLITSTSDLLAISGIGPSTVDSIREYVTQQ
ncbi:MAG: hypothetical protein HOF01_04110 [Chloroflexi bacterium]|nr:hypothetical protein [Chloroflexota bacterium]